MGPFLEIRERNIIHWPKQEIQMVCIGGGRGGIFMCSGLKTFGHSSRILFENSLAPPLDLLEAPSVSFCTSPSTLVPAYTKFRDMFAPRMSRACTGGRPRTTFFFCGTCLESYGIYTNGVRHVWSPPQETMRDKPHTTS